MSRSDIAAHVALAGALLVLALLTTRLTLRRVRIMDYPTPRSAHRTATPKAGGLSIVLTFLVGVAVLHVADPTRINQGSFLGFVGSNVTIAAVSLYDDVFNEPFLVRLSTQLLAVAVVLGSGFIIDVISLPGIGPVQLGWLSWPLSLLWIIGLTNAFNFMDGWMAGRRAPRRSPASSSSSSPPVLAAPSCTSTATRCWRAPSGSWPTTSPPRRSSWVTWAAPRSVSSSPLSPSTPRDTMRRTPHSWWCAAAPVHLHLRHVLHLHPTLVARRET